MTADVNAIFLAAADTPTHRRAAYLDDACGGDAALRQRVEALLRAHDAPSANPATAAYVAAAPAPAELASLFPQLEVIELIGAGGMGAVYKARQPALDRFVALKILPHAAGSDPSFAERFGREARTLAKLSHPGIVPVYDFGSADGLYWFVMEFVDGANLRQAQRAGTLSPADALAVVPQICAALQYAHDEGVAHRDVKPENVLIDRRGRVRVADFGLAKLLGRDPRATHLTGTYQAMGTPHYMAPEQWEKPLDVDHRADIYALGVVVYELLTGELPLGRFEPPSHKGPTDARLDAVVLRMLEKDPSRRYQRAADVAADLEGIGTPDTARLPSGPAAPVARGRGFVRAVLLPEVAATAVFLLVSMALFQGRIDGATELFEAVVFLVYLVFAVERTWRWASRRSVGLDDVSPPFGPMAAVTLLTAVGAHGLPWHVSMSHGRIGLLDLQWGVPSATTTMTAAILATVAALARLHRSQRLALGIAVVALAIAALGLQAASHWYTFPYSGLYVTMALTFLGLIFWVLWLVGPPDGDRVESPALAPTRPR